MSKQDTVNLADIILDEIPPRSAPVPVDPKDIHVVRNFGVPRRFRKTRGQSKYPVGTLEVGDAIKGDARVVRGAHVAARAFRNADPLRKFSSYRLEDGSYVLVRVE